MGWMSLVNSTDREAGKGKLGEGSCFFPTAAEFGTAVHVNRHTTMIPVNLVNEYLSVLSQNFKLTIIFLNVVIRCIHNYANRLPSPQCGSREVSQLSQPRVG